MVPPLQLFVAVVSWNRPSFLQRTLDTLFRQLEGVRADVVVLDNGSDEETRDLIAADLRISSHVFLGENLGINGALQTAIPLDLEQHAEFILVSDADMAYQVPLASVLPVFSTGPKIAAISLQDSPEHPVHERFDFQGQEWLLKSTERGCALVMRTQWFQALRPLPVEQPIDFDWWVMRDAPESLAARGELVAVMPGGAAHLGWRGGESTWQEDEIFEFTNPLIH